jgi:hypothetical protein
LPPAVLPVFLARGLCSPGRGPEAREEEYMANEPYTGPLTVV